MASQAATLRHMISPLADAVYLHLYNPMRQRTHNDAPQRFGDIVIYNDGHSV